MTTLQRNGGELAQSCQLTHAQTLLVPLAIFHHIGVEGQAATLAEASNGGAVNLQTKIIANIRIFSVSSSHLFSLSYFNNHTSSGVVPLKSFFFGDTPSPGREDPTSLGDHSLMPMGQAQE